MKPHRFKLALSSEERFLQQAVEIKRAADPAVWRPARAASKADT